MVWEEFGLTVVGIKYDRRGMGSLKGVEGDFVVINSRLLWRRMSRVC